jgi:hypothetical protein
MQKLGIKDSLPGLLAMPFFQSSVACVRLAFSCVACLFLLSSPCFLLFSFPSSLFCFPFLESWR